MKNVLKKWISVLVIAAILLSSAAICASAAVSVPISYSCDGSGCICVGDDDWGDYDPGEETASVGDVVVFSAVPDYGYDFLFWLNEDTNRVVSFQQVYTFRACSFIRLVAVFGTSTKDLQADGMHRVTYYSEGYNVLYTAEIEVGDTEYYEEVNADVEVGGREFLGWDHTPAEVASITGTVNVFPVYDDSSTFTVTSVVGDETYVQEGTYASTVTVTAPATMNGEAFSYWMEPKDPIDPYDSDEIVGFTSTFSFICTLDVTLVAVYGVENVSGVVTRIAGDVPNFDASSITFYAEHSVTQDYTVLEHGLLMTSDVSIGNDASRFIINPSESLIRKGKSNNTARVGTYIVTKTKWNATMVSGGETVNYYPLLFVRSYITVTDSNGVTATYYSPIHVADYVNRTFTGTLEGNNYDDPFAS